MADGTDYEKALALIGTEGAARVGIGQVAIDLDAVLSEGIKVRRVDYSEVKGLFDSLEAKKAEAEAEATPKQRVQKDMELGRRLVGMGVSRAERAAAIIGKGFGESAMGRAIAASAAKELGRAVSSVEKEFAKVVQRGQGKVKANGLVMPRLSLQDQLSELEQIEAALDRGAFSTDQRKTVESEISGLDAAASKEGAAGVGEDVKELFALRAKRIKDIKGKLDIK